MMNRAARALVVLLVVAGLATPLLGACLCTEMARTADSHACCGTGDAARLTATHDCCPEDGGAVAAPLPPLKALVAPAAVVPAVVAGTPPPTPAAAPVPVPFSFSAPFILRI
ncbi:MAG TPA: hypothetical protein VFO85_11320 [Vicinamibacteria bacterium]|nr:hypothetical protein [Vicinamibacteria bacterium]